MLSPQLLERHKAFLEAASKINKPKLHAKAPQHPPPEQTRRAAQAQAQAQAQAPPHPLQRTHSYSLYHPSASFSFTSFVLVLRSSPFPSFTSFALHSLWSLLTPSRSDRDWLANGVCPSRYFRIFHALIPIYEPRTS